MNIVQNNIRSGRLSHDPVLSFAMVLVATLFFGMTFSLHFADQNPAQAAAMFASTASVMPSAGTLLEAN